MTVSQLLDSLDMEELLEWRAYDQVEGLSDYRQDVRVAKGFAALMSMKLKKGSKGIDPTLLMPNLDAKYREAPSAKAKQDRFIAAIGGAVNV